MRISDINIFNKTLTNDIVSFEQPGPDVTFSVSCELSHPMGKTEFSSTATTEQTLSHR